MKFFVQLISCSLALPSAIAALSLASIGFIGGWSAKSAQIYQQYSPAELEYLGRFWRENSDRLILCQSQKKDLCQIQLSPTRSHLPKEDS